VSRENADEKKKEKEKISNVCSHIIYANRLLVINISSERDDRPKWIEFHLIVTVVIVIVNTCAIIYIQDSIRLTTVSNFISYYDIYIIYWQVRICNLTLVASTYGYKHIQMQEYRRHPRRNMTKK
jgi:hypothetical protein